MTSAAPVVGWGHLHSLQCTHTHAPGTGEAEAGGASWGAPPSSRSLITHKHLLGGLCARDVMKQKNE